LLVKGNGAVEGDRGMAVGREKGGQRQQADKEEGDPSLNIEN
jgi:hypothetical protein